MPQTITVNVVNSVSTGPSTGYFVIPGDFTSLFYPGFSFSIFNGSQHLSYITVSSTFAVGFTQVNVNSPVYGSIVSIGSFTPGTGPFVIGTYTPVPTTTNSVHGSGAQLQVIVGGPGSIASLGVIVGGTGYIDGTYTAVSLTGGTGTGAEATVVVVGGAVTAVTVTATGTGYTVADLLSATVGDAFTVAGVNGNTGTFSAGDTLSASPSGATAECLVTNANATPLIIDSIVGVPTLSDVWSDTTIPGATFNASAAPVPTGSGFSVPVASVAPGTISVVTLASAGVGYSTGDILTFGGIGFGTGNTVPVTGLTAETGSITIENTQPHFVVGEEVFCITVGNASCQMTWWSQMPTQPPIPAVQSGTVLAIDVSYTNSTTSPTITYQVRLGSQPGVVSLEQKYVFIDKPTAIAAYEALAL